MIRDLLFLLAGVVIGVLISYPWIRRVRETASTDTLTGLYNRALFDKMLGRLYAAAVRDKKPLSVLMIDMNHFKEANDRFGHPFGDQVLKAASQAMVASLRASDFIFRYGGDEFLVILPGTAQAGALRVAQKIKGKLDKISLVTPKGSRFENIGASIGVACFPDVAGDETALLRAADRAVYQAKDKRAHIEVATSES